MFSVAVQQFGKPLSISTNVTINRIGTLIADDSSLLTHCEIVAHLGCTPTVKRKSQSDFDTLQLRDLAHVFR